MIKKPSFYTQKSLTSIQFSLFGNCTAIEMKLNEIILDRNVVIFFFLNKTQKVIFTKKSDATYIYKPFNPISYIYGYIFKISNMVTFLRSHLWLHF